LQQFAYNLAKSDLACHYKHCIDGREEVRMRDFLQQTQSYTKIMLLTLKIIRECNEDNFALFKEGPSIMNVNSLEEKLERI
jgi:hypothetical protein